MIAAVLRDLGSVAYELEDYASARSLHEQSLAVLQEAGNKTGIAYGLYYLGLMTDTDGDHAAAVSLFKQSLTMHREAEDSLGTYMCLAGLGDWTGVRTELSPDQRERAVRLLGAATLQFEVMGFVLRPRDRHRYEHGLALARAQLGDEAFEKAWAEGRALSIEQAIEYALEYPAGE